MSKAHYKTSKRKSMASFIHVFLIS